jgi:hypothetical protein
MPKNTYIKRLEADEAVEKLLSSTDAEVVGKSPLEEFDENDDGTPNLVTFTIELDEKHFEKGAERDIIKDTEKVTSTQKTKGGEINGKSNDKEL